MKISSITLFLIILITGLITYFVCQYTLNCDIKCKINYKKVENHIEKTSYPNIIDKISPKMTSKKVNNNRNPFLDNINQDIRNNRQVSISNHTGQLNQNLTSSKLNTPNRLSGYDSNQYIENLLFNN